MNYNIILCKNVFKNINAKNRIILFLFWRPTETIFLVVLSYLAFVVLLSWLFFLYFFVGSAYSQNSIKLSCSNYYDVFDCIFVYHVKYFTPCILHVAQYVFRWYTEWLWIRDFIHMNTKLVPVHSYVLICTVYPIFLFLFSYSVRV